MSHSERRPRPLLSLAIATACGVGYVPVAPGTAGSLVGLLLWIPLRGTSMLVQAAVILAILVAGSLAGSVCEEYFGKVDPRQVVADEVMGMLITLFGIPVGLWGALLGFLLFRAADVVKPFPANRLERLPGGFGVMADDGMAAIYANIALRICLWAVPRLG